MSFRKVLEGYVVATEMIMELEDKEVSIIYTIHADRIIDLSLLHGIEGVGTVNSTRPLVEVPYAGRTVRMPGFETTELKIKLPLNQSLSPDTLLGQKIKLVLRKGKLDLMPLNQALYTIDPQIEAKNRAKLERKLQDKLERVYEKLL